MKFPIPNTFPNIVIPQNVWRFLGFGSCLVGFICYAFSPSFHDMFGSWTLFKIVFYSILTILFSVLALFVNKSPQFTRGFLLKAHVGFLVLMLTSLYSFYEDRSKPGENEEGRHRNLLSLVSFGAFAFMSVSLSKQIQPEFDVGMSNFFLGCLIIAIMKMNIKIALGVAALFYVLITVHSYCDSQTELPNLGDTELAIMAQLNQMQTSAYSGDEESQIIVVSESHIEIPSFTIEGHKELDPVGEFDKETRCNNVDELDIFTASPVSFSSPL